MEEQGLRLRFTGGNGPKQPVGIFWNTKIRGDFTATVRYEILQDDRPEKGGGAGVEMYLTLDTPVTEVKKRDGVAYARIMHPGQGPLFTFNYMTNNEKGGRYSKDPVREPTTTRSKQGALRLGRAGTKLVTSFAEGDQDFRKIDSREIGDVQVLGVRLAGLDGGNANAELDLRFLTFELVGKSLGAEGKTALTPPPSPINLVTDSPSGNWTFWVVLIVIVLAVGLFGMVALLVWLTRFGTKSNGHAATAKKPVENTAKSPPAAEFVELKCAACSKRLKVKASSSGKRIKCPGCGESMPVPIADS
jgi:ribosomal protein S27E